MAGDPDIAALNRTMKAVAYNMKEMTRVLETMNSNLVGIYKNFSEGIKEAVEPQPNGYDLFLDHIKATVHPPRVLGWKIADQLEAAGELISGDIKIQDLGETRSTWSGSQWLALDNHEGEANG